MAIVTKFSRANLDFKADVLEKYDSDPVDGIRSCRHLLHNCKLTADEKIFVRIVLARCYMKIDAYDFALRELKIVLANRPNHPDAVFLIVSVLQKLPGTSVSAPLEYFQNLYNELGSCDKVDDVFVAACQQMREADLSFEDNDDLFLVPDEDIIDRLKDKTYKLLSKRRYNEVISLIDKADKKYVQCMELRERLAFACQMIGDCKRAIAEAESNLKMYDNSFFSVIIILDSISEGNIEYDKNKLLDYIIACKIDKPVSLHEALVVLERADWLDSVPKLLENTKHLSDLMVWRVADAITDYHNGNKLSAIEKFKTVNALFGIHSCADEYIKIVMLDKELQYDNIGELPQDYFLEKVQKFALAKESFTAADVNNSFAKEEFRKDLYYVACGGEVKIFQWVMDSLTQTTICKYLDYFSAMLLDEDVYDVEIRKIVLKTIIVKLSNISIPYSSNDVVRFTDFQLEEEDKKAGKRVLDAYALAYSQACFNARNFADSIRSSFLNIAAKVSGNRIKFNNITCLAALIALGGYIYFSDNVVDDIVAMFGANRVIFDKYLKQLNVDGSIYSDKVSEEKFMIQLNDIMKSFGKIEEMEIGNTPDDDEFEDYTDEEWNEMAGENEDDEESDADDDDDKQD